jgi:hypothetical protein
MKARIDDLEVELVALRAERNELLKEVTALQEQVCTVTILRCAVHA